MQRKAHKSTVLVIPFDGPLNSQRNKHYFYPNYQPGLTHAGGEIVQKEKKLLKCFLVSELLFSRHICLGKFLRNLRPHKVTAEIRFKVAIGSDLAPTQSLFLSFFCQRSGTPVSTLRCPVSERVPSRG